MLLQSENWKTIYFLKVNLQEKSMRRIIAEGDSYQSIEEVRVEVVSRAVFRKIPKEISGAAFGKISRVKVEIEARKAKE